MKGKVIELRLWRPEYGAKVCEWYESDEYPMFFRSLANPPIDANAFANFPTLIGQLVFGVFDFKNNMVGLCTAYAFDPNSRVASAGVMVDKKYQKMGIASECFLILGRWLYEAKNLRKVSMEFSGSDPSIQKILNRFAAMFDPSVKEDDPLEKNPYFEGRHKKEVLVKGKYVDIIRVGGFKNQFEKLLEKIKGDHDG